MRPIFIPRSQRVDYWPSVPQSRWVTFIPDRRVYSAAFSIAPSQRNEWEQLILIGLQLTARGGVFGEITLQSVQIYRGLTPEVGLKRQNLCYKFSTEARELQPCRKASIPFPQWTEHDFHVLTLGKVFISFCTLLRTAKNRIHMTSVNCTFFRWNPVT